MAVNFSVVGPTNKKIQPVVEKKIQPVVEATSAKQRLTMVQGSCRISILTNTGEINGQ